MRIGAGVSMPARVPDCLSDMQNYMRAQERREAEFTYWDTKGPQRAKEPRKFPPNSPIYRQKTEVVAVLFVAAVVSVLVAVTEVTIVAASSIVAVLRRRSAGREISGQQGVAPLVLPS